MRFRGLSIADPVPDANTLWDFREALVRTGAFDQLFERLDRAIKEAGYLSMSGQIVDASPMAAPRQRKTEEEKAAIRAGRVPDAWKRKPAKQRQKDRDARWTVKFTKAKPTADGKKQVDPSFGYQNHVSIDGTHGLIRKWDVTDAAKFEGAMLRDGLLDKTNTAQSVWADSAYRSKPNETFLAKNGFTSKIHRKKPQGRPMPRRTARANARKSAVRARVEHVFGEQKERMDLFVRTIGLRAPS